MNSIRQPWGSVSLKRRAQRRAPESVTEALRLLKRQAVVQSDLRRACGSPVTEERELLQIRHRLAGLPSEVQSLTLIAADLHRPIAALTLRDIERN
jgi:hypothetical protein